MKEVPLTRGYVALVDDDFDKVSQYAWRYHFARARRTAYAYAPIRVGGRSTTIKMHRLILNAALSE